MTMKIFRLVLLLLGMGSAYGAPIPTDRLPPLGYWNPGVIGADGTTYRQNGYFVPPLVLNNVINVKNPPYNAVGDGINDDTAAIKAAIANGAYSIIYLPTGIYKVTQQLELANPNYPWTFNPKILRGDGPTKTLIKSSNSSGSLIDISGSEPGMEQAVYLATPAARGSTTITLAGWGNSQFNSQNWGIIYVSNNVAGPPWAYGAGYTVNSKAQIVHITSRNSSAHTVTFDTPLYFDADTNTQFTVFYSSDSAIGIENLSVENVGGANVHNINFSGVFNCWVRNVESKNAVKWHIRFQDCARCTVEGCYVHGYYPAGGVGGGDSDYGVGFYQQSSDNLAVNNHFDRCRHAMIVEYGDIGNVFAYNYDSNPINEGQESTDVLMGDMIQHGSTAFNLWEGNIGGIFRMDDVIGGSVYNMSFRNNMTRASIPAVNEGQWGYDIQTSNYWISVVGSVMNNVSYSPTWRVGAPDNNGDYPDPPGGFSSLFASPVGTPADPAPTLYLHGVLDLQSNVFTWASSNADHTLPNSLWLNVKPLFLTNYVWPGIGPDISGYTNVIPALGNYFGYDAPGVTNQSLVVAYGAGSGAYLQGSSVTIVANVPSGDTFRYWTGNISTMANTNAASTTITLTTNLSVAAFSSPTTLTDGLVTWYKFDDGSGASAMDSSGNGNTGGLINSPAWTSGIPTNGVASGALNFNGTSQYVTAGDPFNSLNNWTISAWWKSSNTNQTIAGRGHDNMGAGWSINFGTTSATIITTSPLAGVNVSSSIFPSPGTWNNTTLVWVNGVELDLYVNGALAGSTSTSNTGLRSSTVGFDVAFLPQATNYFQGTLDDFRLYNRALSATEIQNIFNFGATTTFPSPPGKLFVLPVTH
jgi:hypothetical protein